ncbi:MAG: SDR family oxidoreductase [Pseudohongiellaceae bacterium]
MNLQGKTIVLTGASGGIGQAIAIQLAEHGARLILVGRNTPLLAEIARRLRENPAQHCILSLDLEKPEGLEELVNFCHGLPDGIDVLINNAGVCDFSFLEDVSVDTINQVINLNLTTPIMLTFKLLPLLKESKHGVVVNIGSVLGAIGNPGYSIYCASKAGLSRFSESLRRELADSHINILHINPRATATEMNPAAVNAMNAELGIVTDPPLRVATQLLTRILEDNFSETSIGWPERLYIKINALIPQLVDKSFARNLPIVKRHARARHSALENIADNLT